MMTDEGVVKVSDLEVKYDRKVILRHINLSIQKGEIVGLLGPSGSGKTTLVKAMIGMKEAVSGQVQVLGQVMPSLKVVNQIGYMAQSDALYEDLTARDNLLFFGELYGVKGKIAKARTQEVLKLVSLEQDASKAVKNFSGGMKRRLSLAGALMHSPALLILDEPTVGIDPVLRQNFWEEFNRIKNNGGSIIVTTHVMDEAYRCDRLALIREGEIIAEGTPQQIIEAAGCQTIEEAFLYFSKKIGGAIL